MSKRTLEKDLASSPYKDYETSFLESNNRRTMKLLAVSGIVVAITIALFFGMMNSIGSMDSRIEGVFSAKSGQELDRN